MMIAFLAIGCQNGASASCTSQLYPPRLLTYGIVSHEQFQVSDGKQLVPLEYSWIGGRITQQVLARFGLRQQSASSQLQPYCWKG